MISSMPHIRSAGSGPEVLLLHSSGSSGKQWEPLMSALRNRYRLHAVDLHGHGGTAAWSAGERMRLEDEAELVAPLLRAAGRVHLVGHSYGGALALKLATMFPERIGSVAVYEPVPFRLLIDYHPRDRAATEVTTVAASIRHWLELGQPHRSARRFVDFWSGDGAWDTLPVTARTVIVARMPAIVGHFRALFADTLTRSQLAQLAVPVLCMTGAQTRATTRRLGELLRLALPQASHVTLFGMGHMGPVSHATQVTARIERFLDARARVADHDALVREAA